MGSKKHNNLNWEIYRSRVEPTILSPIGRNAAGQCYENLRETDDPTLLKDALKLLQERDDLVIMPWISAPYGTVRGYGLYERQEAEQLKARAKHEGWDFPRPGPIYDRQILEAWIRSLDRPAPTRKCIESRL